MKKIVSIVLAFCLSCGFCVCSFAESLDKKELNPIISRIELNEIKSKYSFSSSGEKRDYAKEIFDSCGIDSKFAGMLNDSMLNMLIGAEEIGCISSDSADSNGISSTLADSGSNYREYDDIGLGVLWVRNGSDYSLLGTYGWKKLPITRYYDIMSIDMGGGSVVANSQSAVMEYEKNGVITDVNYNSKSPEYCGVGSACAFKINIPNSMDKLAFVIAYSVTSYSSDKTVCSQYFHTKSPISLSIGASYIIGISVSPAAFVTEYNIQCGIT